MNNENRNTNDIFEETVTYQTGSTQPPKSRGGIIAVLLVLVIFLCGVVTFMTLMNIRLVTLLNAQTPEESSPVSFFVPETTANPTTPVTISDGIFGSKDDDSTLSLHSAPTGVPNAPQSEGLSLQEIYENTIDSVVSISCTSGYGSSTGTGLILTRDGYIVTNAHVIENASSVQVILQNKQSYHAMVVGMDEITDLAVLHIDAQELSPATLGDSSTMRVGDTVVAIGDPLGIELSGSMTDGIVSAINRDISVDGRTMTLIQTNAALNSGNSGGPLINCYGQVVGINTMKIGDYMSSAGVEGLGFAIPSATVSDIVTQLIEQGYVSGRPTLGIEGEDVTTFYQLYYNLPMGFYISSIDPNCDTEKQGLRVGDIILSIDDVRITSGSELEAAIYSYDVGDVVKITVYREGRQKTYQVTIEEDKG